MKSMPDGGQRQKKSKLKVDTLSELIKSIADILNIEFDDLSSLSTPGTSLFSVILMLSENFPARMRILY